MKSLEALVGTADGIDYFIEREELGLFTHDEYREAFEKAQLQVFYDNDAVLFDAHHIGMYWGKKKVYHISNWTWEGFRQRPESCSGHPKILIQTGEVIRKI